MTKEDKFELPAGSMIVNKTKRDPYERAARRIADGEITREEAVRELLVHEMPEDLLEVLLNDTE